jgi:hypothetical protein
MFTNLIKKFFFPYVAYNCDDDLPEHTCNPCDTDREFGRVRSVAMISKDYLATLLAAPTLEATWQAGIDAGKIVIIPNTSGSYAPGDPSQLRGYGDNKNSNGPREQTLNYFDPNLSENYQFYNAIGNVSQKVIAFRTSNIVHIADVTSSIVAGSPVEDDLESEVVWNVTAKWTSANLPQMHSAELLADIFSCRVFEE